MHESLSLLMNYAIAAWQRRWYGVCLAWLVCVVGWLAVERIPDRYQSSAQVNIDTTSMLRPLMAGIAADLSAGAMAQLNIVRQTLLTRPNLERVMRMTDLDLVAKTEVEKEEIMASLRSRLGVNRGSAEDNLFSVSFVDRDPQVAHDVVQALLTIFVETNLGANREDLATTQEFLDNQLTDYKRQIDAAEQQLTQFQLQNRGFLPGPGSYDEELRNARGTLSQLQAERTQADELRNQFSGQLSQVAQGDNAQDNALAQRLARIEEFKRLIDDLLTRYTENHPDVVVAKRLLEREEAELEKEGGAEALSQGGGLGQLTYDQLRLQIAQQNAMVTALDQRIAQFQAEIAKLEALVKQIPEVVTRHTQLQREYDLIRGNYAALTQRREAARFAEEVDTKTQPVQFRIVEPPNVPASPSGPDRPMLQSGVLAGGIAAGAGFCVLLGLVAGTINNTARLAELSQRPIIGAVTRLTLPGRRRALVVEQFAFLVVSAGLFAGYLFAVYGPAGELSAAIASRIPVI
jgi:polysaccharide chain length determinant protein (PEP-CTERM system associated)